jgi:hypothetical protein
MSVYRQIGLEGGHSGSWVGGVERQPLLGPWDLRKDLVMGPE